MSLNSEIKNNVSKALNEDIGDFDLTTLLIKDDADANATVICREKAVLCGIQWFDMCFKQLSPQTKIYWFCQEGDTVNPGQRICEIKGRVHSLLSAERSALNFLQTLSAVATETRFYVNKVKGTGALIVDTRKTLPGLRIAQKYAVACGGGVNHRIGLFDGILIKENHILSAGGIKKALDAAKAIAPKNIIIQIEVETKDELYEALNAEASMILLDNFDLDDLKFAVKLAAKLTNKKAVLEASGNITLNNVREIAETGVNRISIGSITKNIKAIDFSMNFLNKN